MRRGELGPMMYLILAIMALLAILFIVVQLGDKSFGIVDWIRGKMP